MSLGQFVKQARLERNLSILQLSKLCNIDQALISKYENNKRLPSEKDIYKLANGLMVDYMELKKYSFAEKIAQILQYESNHDAILKTAENRIEYLTANKEAAHKVSPSIEAKLASIDALHAKWQTKKPLKGI